MRRTAPRRDVAEIARWHARAATVGRARAWATPGHCGRVRAVGKLEMYRIMCRGRDRRDGRRGRPKSPQRAK